jgi:hypothetical protein
MKKVPAAAFVRLAANSPSQPQPPPRPEYVLPGPGKLTEAPLDPGPPQAPPPELPLPPTWGVYERELS